MYTYHAPREKEEESYQEQQIPIEKLIELIVDASQEEANQDCERLLREGFARVVKGHDDASAALKLYEKYEEEETLISSRAECKNEEIKKILDRFWLISYSETVRRTCDRFRDEPAEKQRKLADACNQLSSKLHQSVCDDRFLRQFTPRISEITNAGRMYLSDNQFIHAAIALYAGSKLHKLKSCGDESVYGILTCSWLMTFATADLAKVEGFELTIVHFVIPLMQEILKFVRSIRSSSHQLRNEGEAWCLVRIGLCYYHTGEHAQHAKICDSAISLIRRKFKKDLKNRLVYGVCLNNAGCAHERLGDSKQASELFQMSLDAYERVKDWSNERQKQAALDAVRYNLKLYEVEQHGSHEEKISKRIPLKLNDSEREKLIATPSSW